MISNREFLLEIQNDNETVYALPYERVAQYLDPLKDIDFLANVRERARRACIEREGKEEAAADFDERMNILISQIDTRKFALLESYILNYGEKYLDDDYLPKDSLLKEAFALNDKNIDQKLINAFEDIVNIPINALYTPELNRYYYDQKNNMDSTRMYEENAAYNREQVVAFIKDLSGNNPNMAYDIQYYHDRFEKENARLAELERAEREAANKLIEHREAVRNRRISGSEITTDEDIEEERIEKELLEAFVLAQQNTHAYRTELIEALNKETTKPVMTDYMHDARREQLETGDFTYLPLLTDKQSENVGQITIAEKFAAETRTAYTSLSNEERIDVVENAVYGYAVYLVEKNDEIIGNLLTHKLEIDEIKRTLESSEDVATNNEYIKAKTEEIKEKETILKNGALAIKANLEDSASTMLKQSRYTTARTMQLAINMIEEMSPELDENQRSFVKSLLDSEQNELAIIDGFKSDIYALDIELGEIEAFERLGITDHGLEGLDEKRTRRDELKRKYEEYTSSLVNRYRSFLDSGYITPEFFEAKRNSIEFGGVDGFTIGKVNPILGIEKEKFVATSPKTDKFYSYYQELDRAANINSQITIDTAKLEKSGKKPSVRAVKKFIANAEKKAFEADAIKREAYSRMRNSTAKDAARQIELVSRGKHPAVAIALSDFFEQEGFELKEFADLRNQIGLCDAKLTGFIIATELKMEKQIYSEKELKDFGNIVWQKGKLERELETKKQQFSAYYTANLEAGVFSEEFVNQKLASIENGCIEGYTMADCVPYRDVVNYAMTKQANHDKNNSRSNFNAEQNMHRADENEQKAPIIDDEIEEIDYIPPAFVTAYEQKIESAEKLMTLITDSSNAGDKEIKKVLNNAKKNYDRATKIKSSAQKEAKAESKKRALMNISATALDTVSSEIVAAAKEAYNREVKEMAEFERLHKEYEKIDSRLVKYTYAACIGREGIFTASEIKTFNQLQNQRAEINKRIESYQKNLVDNYNEMAKKGLISKEYLDIKVDFIKNEGRGGFALGKVKPFDAEAYHRAIHPELYVENSIKQIFNNESTPQVEQNDRDDEALAKNEVNVEEDQTEFRKMLNRMINGKMTEASEDEISEDEISEDALSYEEEFDEFAL